MWNKTLLEVMDANAKQIFKIKKVSLSYLDSILVDIDVIICHGCHHFPHKVFVALSRWIKDTKKIINEYHDIIEKKEKEKSTRTSLANADKIVL